MLPFVPAIASALNVQLWLLGIFLVITFAVCMMCRAWVVQSVFGWMFWHQMLSHLSQGTSSDLQIIRSGDSWVSAWMQMHHDPA